MGDEPFCDGDVNKICFSDDDREETHNCTTDTSQGNRLQSAETAADCQSLVMAERDRRNGSRLERVCNNAAQSKNHTRHQETSEPARNRHREVSGVTGSTRNRTVAALRSSNQGGEVAAEMASSEVSASSASEEGMVEDVVHMAIEPLPGTSTPIKTSEFLGLSSEAIHTAMSTHNWQSSTSTVKERVCFMFNNELMADVYFIVGRGTQSQRIPAHKFVLSISSAVFDAMFNGCMATNSADIELPDVEPAAFLSMLRFMYTDEVAIGPDTVMHCLYTAKKYAVVALERACVDFLKRNLSSDNAFVLLTQARLFDEPQLAALCLEMIDKMTTEAVNADSFTDIDVDTLCMVLERDTLGIRECKLFHAVCRWAEMECTRRQLPITPENLRSVLLPSHALELIRFPLMTVEEFAIGPAQSGLLTDREVVELFLYFTVTSSPRPTVRFSDVPRCCSTDREQVISRFCKIETRWGYSGTSDRIRFTVNRKIFVVGFGLYGSIHAAAEYSVNIQMIHTDTGQTCGSNDSIVTSDGSKSTFRVMFKEPIEVQANTGYTACATLRGPDSYYGTKGLRKVTHESMSNGKVTFCFSYAAGNNNGTSVEDGQLPEIIFYT